MLVNEMRNLVNVVTSKCSSYVDIILVFIDYCEE